MDLFNRNRDGSKELEDLTGQWYASSPFRLIETEIRFATDEVARLVSLEVVKEAAEAYDEDEKPELVAAVRLPVACLAVVVCRFDCDFCRFGRVDYISRRWNDWKCRGWTDLQEQNQEKRYG